jgi:hypothetical protein
MAKALIFWRLSRPVGRGDGGYAVMAILVITALLLVVGVIGVRSASIEVRISGNELAAQKAFSAAEAGLAHAISLIAADGDGLQDELTGRGTGGGLEDLGAVVPLNGDSYRFRSFGGSGSADGYYVRVVDNFDEVAGADNRAVDVDSVAYVVSHGKVGAGERTVRSAIRVLPGASSGPGCAILVNGDLMISGNPVVVGTRGCAHANEDVGISGNPRFETGATASRDMDISGNPNLEGENIDTNAEKDAYEADHDSWPLQEIPSVRPFQFGPDGINLAEAVQRTGGYRLDSNCRVYSSTTAWTCNENSADWCTGGLQVADLSRGAKWNGWECSSDSSSIPRALWKVGGDTATNGAFFVEGWVNISGNPGQSGRAWESTLVAMNTIDISGNPKMAPFATSGDLRNMLLVSGNDIGLGGTLGASGKPAGVFAHQQVKNNGDFLLTGFLVSEAGGTTWAGDPAPNGLSGKDLLPGGVDLAEYDVSGNARINYSGLDVIGFRPGPATVERFAWAEVRNF